MTLKCTMILGDCLEVMPALGTISPQLCFADFPYGKKTECSWDVAFPVRDAMALIKQKLSLDGTFLATAVQPFTSRLISVMPGWLKYTLVWNKNAAGSPAMARRRPMSIHEDVCVFGSKRSVYNPQMTLHDKPMKLTPGRIKTNSLSAPMSLCRKHLLGRVYTDKFPTSIIFAPSRAHPRGMHPTQKPLALLNWLIRTYSNPSETVLDPVSGSGTTACAALLSGRSAVCIEKDEGYFNASVERVRKTIADNAIDAHLDVRR